MTDKVMEMARRIARDVVNARHLQRDNGVIYSASLEAAAAAIREAQRLDAEVAERAADQNEDTSIGRARNQTARDVAEEIRTGDQYGEAKP